ncbi:MAG: alpha/beta hydrolase [Candidatus Dormibacteria bacterium]|jgi:pimeloyl-ACP methyl ester carboxylesterase
MTTPFETVRSADGTTIAVERSGEGRPVVLIGGAFSDRATAAGLAQVLAPHFTTVTYDRRGRGDSGDSDRYALEREIEDLTAVIEGVGGRAGVFGHSSGAILALEAASAGAPIRGVVAYEPPYISDGFPRPAADLVDRLRALIAQDRRDDAVALFQTEAIGIPAQVVAGFRTTEMWPGLVAVAHTLPYDVEITGPGNVLRPGRLGAISVPTLIIAGTASMPWMLPGTRAAAAAIPGGRHLELAGADHGTPQSHPDVLLQPLLDFYT